MPIPAILVSSLCLALAAPQASSQEPPAGSDVVQVATSAEWDRLLAAYKLFQGGAERFDGVRAIAFDYTPSSYDEEGKEVLSHKRHITALLREDADEQELRAMRIEAEIEMPGTGTEPEKVKTVSIVTPIGVKVWSQDKQGAYLPVEARELQEAAVYDAKGLWAQLDLLLFPDNPDLRCSFVGLLTRDAKQYAAVEAEFRPGRMVPEPSRLYFGEDPLLVQRIDVFGAKSHLRTTTIFVEDYVDHGGVKFPQHLRFVDRRSKPLGDWHLDAVKLNPELSKGIFVKP